jgi:phosphatidylinositol alpha-1,6-mannosyltransferase
MIKAQRLRILLITRNLPPLVGGMERLIWHMADELSKRADVRIVGPCGARVGAPSGVEVIEVPLRPLARFLVSASWQALRIAHAWRPRVVIAGSGLTAPLAWAAARVSGARALAYLHGLDVAVRSIVYRSVWLPAIRRMDRVITNSSATAKLAIQAGVDRARIGIVHPGVTLPDSETDVVAAQRFRDTYDLGTRPILLSVGRLTQRKGLREFVRDVLPRIVAEKPDTLLVVIGDVPSDALLARFQTPESIQAAADAAGVGENIRFIGVITDRERLADAYRAAQVHVFPVRELPSDPEGFGMVAIEAAAHGLPTVAYATGGIMDAVSEGKSGYLVNPGDAVSFADSVCELLDHPMLGDLPRAYGARFAWPHFGDAIGRQLFAPPNSEGDRHG